MPAQSVWKIVGGITTAGTLCALIWGAYMGLDTQIKTTVASSTTVLSKEIADKTIGIVEMHYDDLKVRIRLIKRDIESYEDTNRPVPPRLRDELEALQDQVEEIERKWFTK